MLVPFTKKTQLNDQLEVITSKASNQMSLVRTDDTQCTSLPGQPRVSINSSSLYCYLEKEFLTPDLDTLAPHLWLVATQSSSHIAPLHEHIAKGREIVITENPELHLVWTERCIYIKPIPRFMLSHALWTVHFSEDLHGYPSFSALPRAVLGYIRTYYYLIQYESDFQIAMEKKLLPFDNGNITLESFFHFIAGFGDVQDDIVSPRYSSYGVLRLSRLNFWAKIFLFRFQFYVVHGRYSDYFGRFYTPILFMFGVFTLALSAMQVSLAVVPVTEEKWTILQRASLWFSVATLLCVCCTGLAMFMMLLFMVLRELRFATKDLMKRRKKESTKGP